MKLESGFYSSPSFLHRSISSYNESQTSSTGLGLYVSQPGHSKTPGRQPCLGPLPGYLPTHPTLHRQPYLLETQLQGPWPSTPKPRASLWPLPGHQHPSPTFRTTTISSLQVSNWCMGPVTKLHSNKFWASAHLNFHLHGFAHVASSIQMFFLMPRMRPLDHSFNLFI